MIVVAHLDGTPRLFVDAHPVTLAAYRTTFPNHQQPPAAGSGDTDTVAGVPLNFARAYAKARGGRLVSDEEWGAASRTPGFVNAGTLDEWIDNGDGTPRRVRRTGATAAIAAPSNERTLTFRIAAPPAPNP